MSNRKTLFLVDGSAYLYRAYHALPPLTNSRGEHTGAVFGVANMLRKLVAEQKPEYIAIIFDAKGKNFRHELYDAYKAQRPPMPDELRSQIPLLHNLLKAMGLPLVCTEGVEADDVIATLAKQAEREGWLVKISTIDKDIMQLVNSNITIINDVKKVTYDEAGVKEKFGIPAHLVVDYLALIGDKVDNVPGIPGVGPKTAVKWLNDYRSLDNVIANAHLIQNKAGLALKNNLQQLALSKELVTLKTDVKLDLAVEDLKKKLTIREQLITSLETLGFKSWLNDVTKSAASEDQHNATSTSFDSSVNKLQIISDETTFQALLNKLNSAKAWSFGTETTSLDPMVAELVGLAFSVADDDTCYYIPLKHIIPMGLLSVQDNEMNNAAITQQLDMLHVLEKLKPVFNNHKITKIAHNLKYDITILKKHNIVVAPPIEDTMLESYVFNSTANKHDLVALTSKYLQPQALSYDEIAGKGAKQLNFSEVSIAKAAAYSVGCVADIFKLHQSFSDLLQADKKLLQVYHSIELPLINVLADMEIKGILIDRDLLSTQSKALTQKIAELEGKIHSAANTVFNIDSPKQLQEVLYDKLLLPVLEKTPTGQPSTAESVLQDLALDHPIAHDILEYRSLRKLKTTYTDKLPEQINPITKRIHTSFHQAVTATGRLSSSNPNLQNIPIKTEEGRKIRQAFIAPTDHVLMPCDYSQIELRIMAHLSKDTNLIRAFNNDEDIHSATAAEIFNIDLNAITSEHRRHAKAINFGLIYGMSAFGLAKQLGIDRQAAQAYIDVYFARYPGVKDYMDNIRKLAEKQGYVETLFGRRLYLPEIKGRNFMQKRAMERLAINAPMQGTAADIIKKAMIAIHAELCNHKILASKATLILQVHDELIIEIHKDHIPATKEIVVNAMQTAASLLVPLKVSCNIGANWDEAH